MQMTHEDSINLTRAVNKLRKQLNILANQLHHNGLKDTNSVHSKKAVHPTENGRTSSFYNQSIKILRSQIHRELRIIRTVYHDDPIDVHNSMWHVINNTYVFTHVIMLSDNSYMCPLNSLLNRDDSVDVYCKYMKHYIDSKNNHVVNVESLSEIRHNLISVIDQYLHRAL